MENERVLRQLPKMDALLAAVQEAPESKLLAYPVLHMAARAVVDTLRREALGGSLSAMPPQGELVRAVLREAERLRTYVLRPAINATGVVLHTNLGRALLGEAVAEHVRQVATQYSTLEYDAEKGERGSRHAAVEGILQELTGCEAAMAVNNNAAAVLLTLTALCKGKEVILSRGELVEIGGSFRVPDVMEQGGVVLKEVGTTNKTRLSDYAAAISPGITGALLKVHTSNFKIIGFTEEVSLQELAELGDKQGLPVLYDLGSGILLDAVRCGTDEPTVLSAVLCGADVVMFSGDKLLGGPQAGIILGRKKYIKQMKRHPLARALRIDKLSLAALEATLHLYRDEKRAVSNIPVLSMLSVPLPVLREKAERLMDILTDKGIACRIKTEQLSGQAGGGSLPGWTIPSYGVAIRPESISISELDARLRGHFVPIVGRISKDRYLMDMRTVPEEAFSEIAAALFAACGGKP